MTKAQLKSQIALIDVCEHELDQQNEIDVFDYMAHIESVHGRKLWKNEGGDFIELEAFRIKEIVGNDDLYGVLARARQMFKSELNEIGKTKEQKIEDLEGELGHDLLNWDWHRISCLLEDFEGEEDFSDFMTLCEPIAKRLQDFAHNKDVIRKS